MFNLFGKKKDDDKKKSVLSEAQEKKLREAQKPENQKKSLLAKLTRKTPSANSERGKEDTERNMRESMSKPPMSDAEKKRNIKEQEQWKKDHPEK